MVEAVAEKVPLSAEAQAAWDRLNRRQQVFCVAYVDCGNASESYRRAGYKADAYNAAAAAAWRLLNDPDVKAVIRGLLEAYKLSPETAGVKLFEGLNATETRFFAHEGVIVSEREVVDFRTRATYLDMLCKLLGLYKQQPLAAQNYQGPVIYLPEKAPLETLPQNPNPI